MDLPINSIVEGHVLDVLADFPKDSVNCMITSPPYWGLRAYKSEPQIWGGRKDCGHEWGEMALPASSGSSGKETIEGGKANQDMSATRQKHKSRFCRFCSAWRGELGLEPTPELYIEHLMMVFDEAKRVLRKDGICFVNIGDTYSGSGIGTNDYRTAASRSINKTSIMHPKTPVAQKLKNIPAKSLCAIPERFVLAMMAHGWIRRCTIIWAKGLSFCPTYSGSCMPDSCKDRPNKNGFEYLMMFVKSSESVFWVHNRKLLMVSKRPKPDYRWVHASGYELTKPPAVGKKWKELKEKRVPCPDCGGTGKVRKVLNTPFFKGMLGAPETCSRCYKEDNPKDHTVPEWERINLWQGHDYFYEQQFEEMAEPERTYNQSGNTKWDGSEIRLLAGLRKREQYGNPALGRTIRNVWAINPEPFPDAHFATFPRKLVEPLIKMGCPDFVCSKCGKARKKIYKTHQGVPTENYRGQAQKDYELALAQNPSDTKRRVLESQAKEILEIGLTDCGCGAKWVPGVTLDPFMGSGTTCVVTYELRRDYIGIELQGDYVKMANKRLAQAKDQYSLLESR